ncbi:MAG: mycofactocin precursor MftA [Acidimicrobiales bacterium]
MNERTVAKPVPQASHPEQAPGDEQLVEEDLLVEEISIDGMCGVY